MNVRNEIDKFSDEDNKKVLHWLFSRYSLSSSWHFVAYCNHQRYGKLSYETNRVWFPTNEGKCLYNYLDKSFK